MTQRQVKRMVLCAAVCVSSCALRAEIDYGSRVAGDEPRLYVDRYGKDEAWVVNSGYLFVEFDYIPPPYHIQRVGQGVVVNGVLVNCLFRRDPPIGGSWNSFSEAKLKNGANYFAERVAGFLERHEAVFLYKEGYQNRSTLWPISEASMSIRVPIFGTVGVTNFPHLLNDAMTNPPPAASAVTAIVQRAKGQDLTVEYIQTLISNVRQDTQLLARVRSEMEAKDYVLSHARPEFDYGSRVTGDEPGLYVDRYGKGESAVISNGYLFVDFDYIPSPYHIQRVGQAVVVNGMVVNYLFRGDPPVGETRRGGMSETELKRLGDEAVHLLAGALERRKVVFLDDRGFQSRGPSPSGAEWMLLHIPIFDTADGTLFPYLLNDALTNSPPAEATIKAISQSVRKLSLEDEDIHGLIKRSSQNPQLLERVSTEIKLTPRPQARARYFQDTMPDIHKQLIKQAIEKSKQNQQLQDPVRVEAGATQEPPATGGE